jgi:hypothetical protein
MPRFTFTDLYLERNFRLLLGEIVDRDEGERSTWTARRDREFRRVPVKS